MAGSFSFDTPEEVMHVLASVRASGVDATQKNQIRDLVLSYTNGGKDPSLKIQIEQQLTQLGIAPNAAPTKLSAEEEHGFGSSRSVPSFFASAPATPAQTSEAKPTPAVAAQPTVPAAPVAPVTPPPVPQSQPTPEPVANPVQPQPVVPTQAQPAVPPAVTETPVAPTAPAAPTATPNVPTPPAPPTPDALQRIREIKALVNEKVGNPVNLVDIDNAVGREYMSALLDAMKKLNGGGDITSAMSRLEAAYSSVETVLENRDTTTVTSQPATPAVAAQPAPVEEADAAVSVPIRSSAPMPAVTSETSDDSAARWANNQIRVPDSVAPVRPAPEKAVPTVTEPVTPPPPKAVPMAEPEPVAPPVVKPVQPPEPPKPKLVINATPPPAPKVDLAPQKASDPVAETANTAIKPLSKTGKPLKSVDDLPTPDSLETASKSGDPLYTKEVDDGLNQLLSDWVLFKKSGLFGSGPKGLEHPLYLKIKELQIPILLAGRFEGATQEIKQSITDYMNGWRYEQGIIYEQGETFEHYLRRVIRHIIDLQK